ncbi:MAG: amino acid adenylation domain-containing protein [Symploca sp. SIO1B1]|nr:amino acid adenylation domain-containing protein [Symploca sp. SIO1B1]
MISIGELLTNLRSLGIEVWAENGKLKYRAVSGSLTAELREQLAERKIEIISFLQTVGEAKSEKSRPIQPQERTGYIPLSTAQQRLWFVEQLMSQSFAYNVSGGLRLLGELKVDILQKTLNEIVRRHESLRTIFKVVEGKPIQVIAPSLDLELPIIALQSLPKAEQETEILNIAVKESQRPFQLDAGPLLRASLLHCGRHHHVLLLNMHHIVTDGWSINLFIKELQTLYPALLKATVPALPQLPIQYADFALWQQQRLQSQAFQEELSYWKKQLTGIETLSLPGDRPRPPVQSFRGSMMSITLPGKLIRHLEALSRREKVSLSTLMLGAFQTLLYRYTHQQDIAVASPIANRNRSEIEGLIGFFVNTLILRTNLQGNPSFPQLLQRIHQTTLEAYDHQDVPFEKIVEELQPNRDLSHNPLSTVSYAFQTIPGESLDLPELTISPLEYDRGTTRYDLEFHLWKRSDQSSNWFLYSESAYDIASLLPEMAIKPSEPDADDLIAIANYSTDLFDPQTIGRFLLHYLNLLQAIVVNPDRPINELPLLTPQERHQLLHVYSKTSAPGERKKGWGAEEQRSWGAVSVAERSSEEERTDNFGIQSSRNPTQNFVHPSDPGYLGVIHQQFETQVEKTPDNLAVLGDNSQLTYKELNTRANQLARTLQKRGVNPETCVGISIERSVELIVGILAILKAGGIYVPLDPQYPQERLDYMIEDTQMPLLLTTATEVERFSDRSLELVCLEQEQDQITRESPDNLATAVTPQNLAYINYTSGSTGQPKGIGIPHSGVTNLVSGNNILQFSSTDRIAHLSNISFDAATFEIWGPLLNGASLVTIPTNVVLSPPDLAATITEQSISIMWLTVALFNQMVQEVPQALSSLKCLIFGGEMANSEMVRRLIEVGSPQQLLNGYGPTEATTFTTFYPVESIPTTSRIPIGRPLAGVRCYILDQNLEPVPVGVAGELYIGGGGLARGYVNRPELTASQFIPDPFSETPGERLYATGDQARYRRDSQIEILGRIDNQVKIRGFRVEPEEVEATLLQHPEVQEAAILIKSKANGDKFLVAYFVGSTTENVRPYLRQKLPGFLVPAAFVPLPSLPLTANGKLDWRSLPEPETVQQSVNENEQPRTPTEEIVIGVWSQVLNQEAIGIHDNFFDLGGHSLLATQVFSRLLNITNVKLPVQTLFEAPTVAELAVCLENEYQSRPQSLQTPIQPNSRTSDLPLSFAQKRLWFVTQLVPDTPGYNIPTAYRLVGELKVNILEKTLNQIISRHETLRTNFLPKQGEAYQVIAPEQPLSLNLIVPAATSKIEREAEIKRLINEAALKPFDLAQEPLIRASVFEVTPEEHILFLNIHHIVSDGWSLGILHREIGLLYQSAWEGNPYPLAKLPIQYADFACWQTQWLQGELLDAQLTYWRQQLTDLPLLGLYSDRPRPPVQTFLGKALNFKLSPSLSQQLKQVSRQQGATLFMTLLSAFKVLLYRYTGQEDIAVGFPIANRNRTEIENLIGFFVNTLVLRTDLSGNPQFQDLLARVRQTTLQAYAHQDLPFEKLVEELEPERDPSRNPLVQVVFALQNAPDQMPELPNLQVSQEELEIQTTRFDLECHLWETPDGLIGKFIYNVELFNPDTGSRMLEHFLRLLEQIGTEPEKTIADFSLLTPSEQQQIVVDWNQTARAYPRELSLHQAFEQQVEKAPEAIALVFGETKLTYAQLNQYANRLASQLQGQGVTPETIVGLCMKRSLLTIIAILAILKVGGVYLPLDPDTPQHRLKSMLEDTEPSLLLTQEEFRSSLPKWDGVILACSLAQLTQGSDNFPLTTVKPDCLAYIMYTSGSTGKPKGIGVSHRAVMRLVNNPNYVSLSADDRLLHIAPFTFDASTFEIWGSLLNGARLVIMPPHTPSLEELAQGITEHKITVMFFTTALFHLMVEEKIDSLASLRQLLVGGEVMSVKLLQAFVRYAQNCQTIHVYGPTENTTFTTFYPVKPEENFPLSIPIGRPISRTTTYILDPKMRPVPVGVPGELYTGGEGLARFYFNRPELTAEKFVPNPFSNKRNDRLYRTGDLARFMKDGSIEFLGRIDTQVKIRGFRIEPGEIETLLNQHPTVKKTVVVPREEAGNKQLVAYLVSQLESEASASGSNEHISQWQSLFEQTYQESSDLDQADFNLAGWNDSYTGQAILPEAMAEWVTHTVASIMAFHPQRVWEIGCGTGLLLLRIASHCSHYLGTDFSPEALQFVQQQLDSRNLSHVELRRQLADDFSAIAPDHYDAIILNSIVQYFPGINYLLQVIRGAVKATAPGGIIFLGDLRCFPLLDAFHTSIQLYKSADSLPIAQLRENSQKSRRFEGELAIDPAFFKQLKNEIPEISSVQILHKRGQYHNELTKYRYDVILQIDQGDKPLQSPSIYDWQEKATVDSPSHNLESLRHLLTETRSPCCLQNIPNARIWNDVKSVQILGDLEDNFTVTALRSTVKETLQKDPGIDPEAFWAIGEELNYTTQVVWSHQGKQGYFDVVFIPQEQSLSLISPFLSGSSKRREWHAYGNNPISEKLTHKIVPMLRSYLTEQLPDYMIPSHFVLLDAIPLNHNGKINKRALPAPEAIRPDLEAAYQAPSTDIEQIIAGIWQEYLRLDRVGIEDNFFDLGGHSLLLVQILSKLQSIFNQKLSVVDMFQYPTVSALAQHLSQANRARTNNENLRSRMDERAEKRKAALGKKNPRFKG